ncbi:hypothetical protein MALV_51190 [Mycolicibacterium alvei]|uniref:Uncharacterized protein n=1 Tax=Mycolicibacterium alvei TaxID=67081 RepID=A0A6N4V284_9MYCO|nr:hypothetical protein MALV_51190 [Mycolicibacterium alvei]
MDTDGTVGLEQQQPAGRWEVGGQPPDIVDGALGNHEAHPIHLKGMGNELG